MNQILKKIIKQAAVFVFSVGIVAGIAYASTWSPAPSNPPSNNAAMPINVSDVGQAKTGNLTANVIGANGFCLGTDCITAWPTGSGSGAIPAGNIKIVETATITNPAAGVASCGTGYKVVGGGFKRVGDISNSVDRPWSSYPNTDSSWLVDYVHGKFTVYAVCIKVS